MKKLYTFLIISCIFLLFTGCTADRENAIYIITNNTDGLVNGYSTVSSQKHKYMIDPSVVLKFDSKNNEDDTKTFSITIHNDLKWSDGESITAKDYVFSVLIDNNPIALDIRNVDAPVGYEIKGLNQYRSLSNNKNDDIELSGLKLIDDYTFSITTPENYTIYIEEIMYDISPLPRHILAPSCEVVQGEVGAKLINFSKDEFKEQYDNEYDNSVTSGPYYLAEKTSNHDQIYKINDFYKGNFEGQKPQIETIIVKGNMNANDQIDIIVPYHIGGLDSNISNQNQEFYKYIPLPTSDFNNLVISCDEPSGASSSINVRQAIAYILKKEEYQYYSYNKIYGLYTLSDWQYYHSLDENGEMMGRDSNGDIISLNPYNYNIEKAEQLLIDDGWIWADKDATILYDAENSEHDYRYKKYNSGYWKDQVLRLDIGFGPNYFNNEIYSQFLTLQNNAKEIGINIYITGSDKSDKFGGSKDGYDIPKQNNTTGEWIIPQYNNESDDRNYQATFKYGALISSNINYYNWVSLEGWGQSNSNYIYDLELIEYSKNMANASSEEEYLVAWQQFQYRYNYLLPSINLGINPAYIIFNTEKIIGLEKAYMMNWYEALLYCTIK